MALPQGVPGDDYRATMSENWFEPSWDHGINKGIPGQWVVTKTPVDYKIVRVGPPLVDRRDYRDWGSLEHYRMELAINRDCLLGACLQAHLPRVPLYLPRDVSDPDPARNRVNLECTFALSLIQMQLPPFNFKNGTKELENDYYIPAEERVDPMRARDSSTALNTLTVEMKAEYSGYLKSVIDGIVCPKSVIIGTVLPGWARLNPLDCTFMYDHDYPGGYTRLECSLFQFD